MSETSNVPALLTSAGITRPEIAITEAAFEAKRVALQAACAVVEVIDADTQAEAGNALIAVRTLAKQVEEARTAINAPVLAWQRTMKAKADNFVAELDAEARRLSLLVGTFQEQERAKLERAAEAARKAEELRLAQLANEQSARVAQETKGRTGTLHEDLTAMQEKAVADVVAIRQDAANVATSAPMGTSVRKAWKYEVLDINALFAGRPDLCKIEPDKTAIRAAVQKVQKIPGLRIWSEASAFVRTSQPPPGALPASVDSYDY